jgi:hypothetical protein
MSLIRRAGERVLRSNCKKNTLKNLVKMESLSPCARSHAEKGNQLVSNMPACVRVFNKYTHTNMALHRPPLLLLCTYWSDPYLEPHQLRPHFFAFCSNIAADFSLLRSSEPKRTRNVLRAHWNVKSVAQSNLQLLG